MATSKALCTGFSKAGSFVELLVRLKEREESQLNVDLVSRYGETPLHLAGREKKPDLARYLMYFRTSSSPGLPTRYSP